ncbi:LysE family translocator [Klebsiella quasipneumoniae]|uniref:LysE family translocator n=1 Tax=Klebsiella quasipneumoniae TaxID=1463165 RepID=UPI002E114A3D
MVLIVTMLMFALALSFSPGPVNMVIISSGAAHGFRKTFSFVSGATIGFTLLLVLISFRLYAAIATHPWFFSYLNIVGSLFILFQGYKIATSHPEWSLKKAQAPGFAQGFLMQWLNPKAWAACASGVALFSEPSSRLSISLFIIIYFFVCYLSLAAWAIFGDKMSAILKSRAQIRLFNLVMGGLLCMTAGYILYSQYITYS